MCLNPIHSADMRLMIERNRAVATDHCPVCGCGFIVKYADGTRICLYCPHKWSVRRVVND